jgi:hypothetical protein
MNRIPAVTASAVLLLTLVNVEAQVGKRPKDADATYDERLTSAHARLLGDWKLTIFNGDKDTKDVKASGVMTLSDGGTFLLKWDDASFQPDKHDREAGNLEVKGTWSTDVQAKDKAKDKIAFRLFMYLPDGKSLFWAPSSINDANSGLGVMYVEKRDITNDRWQFKNWAQGQGGLLGKAILGSPKYGGKLWRLERTATAVGATTAPAPPARTIEIRVGMTEEDVVAAAGQPLKKAILSDRAVWQYGDMTLTLVGGKVADIQLK